jgi:formyltetrahydrofolate-dependent phosphoribosylglycinamide formyltransferase
MKRLAVLASGGGRSLENLVERSAAGELAARIALVIVNTPSAGALERAQRHGLEHVVVDHRRFESPAAFSAAIFEQIDAREIDLVVLAGFLRLLIVPERWLGRVINIHPALLPKFGGKGFYGDRVHSAVLAAGESVSGCTVHYVTNEYDAGPPLLQRRVPVKPGDDAHTLAARVFEEEKLALPQAIAMHFAGTQAAQR